MNWLSGIGSALGGWFGYKGTKDQNVASAQQAQNQMDFQERMSNTAIQRRMADLRKSGLNPILAGKHDASSPSGAQAPQFNKARVALENAATAAQIHLTRNQARTQYALGTTAQAAALPSELLLSIANALKKEHNNDSEKIYQPPIDSDSQLNLSIPDTNSSVDSDRRKKLQKTIESDAKIIAVIKKIFKDNPNPARRQ